MRTDRIVWHEDVVNTQHGDSVTFLIFTRDMAQRFGTGPLPALDRVRSTVAAFINHGRWLAQCPSCPSSAYVSLDVPLFWCVECGQVDNPGYWYEVVLPAARAAIESVLLKRPLVRNVASHRNWVPEETLQMLRNENLRQGIEV